jgi:molybdopterin converting factor small subunit
LNHVSGFISSTFLGDNVGQRTLVKSKEYASDYHQDQTIRLELFGMPRVIAGSSVVEVSAHDLTEVLQSVTARFPDLRRHILNAEENWLNPGYTFVVNGHFTNDPSLTVNPDSDILLVSRASGG